ncbi:hypothetical protein SETIT_1G313300v2 [Setaria italica]|uniref:Uncharacterized protein n=1 Tax=Setaria italica TaxID=4555 RepID=A0A368PTH8_SETIT|nr:hypothetical protein SETIT_1G313300v2 [Setaria italica]
MIGQDVETTKLKENLNFVRSTKILFNFSIHTTMRRMTNIFGQQLSHIKLL